MRYGANIETGRPLLHADEYLRAMNNSLAASVILALPLLATTPCPRDPYTY